MTLRLLGAPALLLVLACAPGAPTTEQLDAANPVRPLPEAMLGHEVALADLAEAPDPEKARLGRWLYYDTRLSADGTLSCATCHIPEHGYSEPRAVSIGIDGQVGTRKAPSFLNAAFAFYPETFWDGRAGTLEEQAIGPMANPIEMGSSHDVVESTVASIPGYAPFFERAFGDPIVTLDRIAEAIADYERTRISGNSPWDVWRDDEDTRAVDPAIPLGDELFFGRGLCATCHVGSHFTDSRFHNLGIGWDEATGTFADEGRFVVSGKDEDRGAFKTPGLRDVALRAPYLHDGSLATLRDVVQHYVKGGTPNPYLSPKMKPLDLSEPEIDALVAFMEALTGEGYLDGPPTIFPQ